jgi:arylsulfatase A-like enzyme
MAAHFPYHPPSECIDMPRWEVQNINLKTVRNRVEENDVSEIKSLYRGSIRFMDDHFGRPMDYIRRKGLMDSTAIIITSDLGSISISNLRWER